MTITRKQEIFLISLAYFLIGIVYALSTPPLEASDEYKHFPFVQYVQQNWRLPELEPEEPGLWLQEGAQPPLYYGLMALLILPVDTTDLTAVHQSNPHAFVGNPNQIGNKNLIIHQPNQEAFPWQGTVLAIYLIRLASIGLGVGTIWIVFRLGTLLFDERTGLLAAALTAFNPMFLFVSAAVNNDSLAIFLGHLGLFLLVQLWLSTPEPRKAWRPYFILGVVLGLGLLTKLSLGGLLGLAGLALAWKAWQEKRWTTFFVGGPLILGPALLIAAPWLWRNWQLYGDLTGLNVFIEVQGTRLNPITWSDWVAEFGTFYRSFWGLFGGVNVAMPEIVYLFFNLFAVVGTAAFLYFLWKQRDVFFQKGLWLLAAWPGVLFLLLVRWNIISPAFQGRLIFPALGAVNLLWVVGLVYLAERVRLERPLKVGLPGAFLLVALIIPWTSIRPAYRYPEPLESVPEEAAFGPFAFLAGGGEIRLVGVEMQPGQGTEPAGNEPVEVVLYWQAVEPVTEDYLSTVHLLGRDNISVGQVNRYPAGGMIPTSQWQPGQIWRDVYQVYANKAAEGPVRLRILAALYDAEEKTAVTAIGPEGATTELLIVGEARLAAGEVEEAEVERPLLVQLADNITFLGYDLSPLSPTPGETITLTLYWQAEDNPTLDYTVFVQLLDAGGMQVAGADGPPANGDFPTDWWRAGDMVTDNHLMQIPTEIEPGNYTILIGMYDPKTGQRLPRPDEQGESISLPLTIGE